MQDSTVAVAKESGSKRGARKAFMQEDSTVVVVKESGPKRGARRALASLHDAAVALHLRRAPRKPKLNGILRDGNKRHRNTNRVTWPAVYVREEHAIRAMQAEEAGSEVPGTFASRLHTHANALRIPTLLYELCLIPLRIAFPELFLTVAAAIVCDVLFDLWGVVTLWLDLTKPKLPASDSSAVPGRSAAPEEPEKNAPPMRALIVREIVAIVPHHMGRILSVATDHPELFMVAQVCRCERVRNLMAYIKRVNNDLTTNVRLLATGKFALILFCIPHWVACMWLIVADGWHIWDGKEVSLPSWPAQFELTTGNPDLNPNKITVGERYLFALYMAYAGLSGLGYPNMVLTHHIEIVLATVVCLLHTVFYAYVLGTLFHYLVRTDENTVNFKALLKACDEFATERKLPPALAAKVSEHYRFQNSKSSSSTDRIFGQLPRTLQTEVSVEQYRKEMDSTWAFFGSTPQFLNALVLHLRERFLPPRQVLFRRGDGALELSWCVGGTLTVTGKDGLTFPSIRADLGPGQIVGEVAFFLGIAQPYTLAASTTSEVTLIYLTSANFEEITVSYPEQTDFVVRTILRKYGLEKSGADHANAAAALAEGSRDRDEQEDFETFRESIRLVIIERNEERLSQMEAAVVTGDLESIRTLIERGLGPNVGSYDGRTALHLAAAEGHVQVVSLLIELSADMDAKDRWGSTPLEAAVDRKQAAVASLLKSRGASLALSQPAARLLSAVRRGDMDELTLLLSLDVSVNIMDHDRRTALHIAAAAGNDLVGKFLISSLADVAAQDRWGCTPLDDAIRQGRTLVIQLLMRSAARPDKKRLAPEIRAAAKRADVDAVQQMLDLGVTIVDACVTMPHYDGRTGLHYAAISGSISTVYMLVAALMDVNMADRWGRTPLVDALETKPEIAALLAHLGATLPPSLAGDEALSAKLKECLSLDMYEIMREIGRRMQLRKDSIARKVQVMRELEIALKTSATTLHGLVRERGALAHTLRSTADRWISAYGIDESDTDTDLTDSDADGSDGDLSADGDDPSPAADDRYSQATTAAKRFVRISLQLPQAEEGLLILKRLFVERMHEAAATAAVAKKAEGGDTAASEPGGRMSVQEERDKRDYEHHAVHTLLTNDLGLTKEQADRTLEEVYAQLAQTLGKTTVEPRGMGLVVPVIVAPRLSISSACSGGNRSALRSRSGSSSVGAGVTGATPQSLSRHGSGVNALFEVGKAARRSSRLADPRAEAMAMRSRSLQRNTGPSSNYGSISSLHLGAPELNGGGGCLNGGAAAAQSMPTMKAVFISDIGFSVLFTSRALVRALAQQIAADEASMRAGSQRSLSPPNTPSSKRMPLWSSRPTRQSDKSADGRTARPSGQGSREGRAAGSSTKEGHDDQQPLNPSGDLTSPGTPGTPWSGRTTIRNAMRISARLADIRRQRDASMRGSVDEVPEAPSTSPSLLQRSPVTGSRSQSESAPTSDARRAVQRTAVIFTQLLAVFDTSDTSVDGRDSTMRPQLRLSDVRRLRLQLGESGSQQITALYEHLVHAAIALGAPVYTQQVRTTHAFGVHDSGGGAHGHDDTAAVAARPRPDVAMSASAEEDDSVPLFSREGLSSKPQAASLDIRLDEAAPVRHTRAASRSLEDVNSALLHPNSPTKRRIRTMSQGANSKLAMAAAMEHMPLRSRTDSASAGCSSPSRLVAVHGSLNSSPSCKSRLSPSANSRSSPHGQTRLARTSIGENNSPATRSRLSNAGSAPSYRLSNSGGAPGSAPGMSIGGTVGGGGAGGGNVLDLRKARRAVLNEAHFFPAVAAWILASTADAEDDVASAEAAAAAPDALMPKLNLLPSGKPKPFSAAEAAPASEDTRLVTHKASSETPAPASAPAVLLEALDASLWNAAVLTGIADRLEQRLDSGRLPRNEAVRADAFLGIVSQAVAIPAGTLPHMLATFCTNRLQLDLADSAKGRGGGRSERRGSEKPGAAVQLSVSLNGPPSWASILRALREAVASGVASGEWQAAEVRGGKQSADTAAQQGKHHDHDHLGKPWYIVSVNSGANKRLTGLFLSMVLFDAMMMPTELVFERLTSQMQWLIDLHIAFDAFYLLRISYCFFVTHVNEKSVEVTDPKACRAHYLATNALADVLAALPLNLVILAVGGTTFQFFVSRVPRLINMRYVYRRHRDWVNSIDDEDLVSGIISTMIVFLLTLHVVTSIMDLLGYSEVIKANTYETWAELYEILREEYGADPLFYGHPETEVLDHYLVSYYETVSLISTVGGLGPANIGEFGFQVFALLITMTVYAVIVGSLSSIVMKQDDEIVAKRAQLELVEGYVAHIRVPKTLKQRLKRFFQQRFKSTSLSSIPPETIFKGLPMELQTEVSKHTNRAVIEAAAILRGCSSGFIDRVSSLLQERLLEAESIVFRTAEACKELIFIAAGAVECYDDPPPDEDPVVFETAVFGETLGDVPFVFNVRHVHNARAIAEGETRIFVLPSTGYAELLKSFTGMHDTIMENAIHKHENNSTAGQRSTRSANSRYNSEGSSQQHHGLSEFGGSSRSHGSHHSTAATESANRLHVILEAAKKRRAELMHIRLCFASSKGEFAKVRQLLNGPAADVNSADKLGRRALHLAACSGNIDVIELLVASRADIDAVDVRGATALVDALSAGRTEAADRLRELGGTRGPRDLSARQCEHAGDAVNGPAQLRTLVLHGCNLDSATEEGRVALHVAAASGHLENVRVLIEGGASVNVCDLRKLTPLDEAVLGHHDACAEYLLAHGGKLNSLDAAMSLNQAVYDGDVQHLLRLVRFRCGVNARDDFDRTPLHIAASCKRVSAMQFLLEQAGIDVNSEDVYGATPLDDAEHVERETETKVLTALLLSAGAKRGSRKSRTSLQPFRNAKNEEAHLEKDAKVLAQTEELLAQATQLGKWVEEQRADVKAMRKLIDNAIRTEDKLGPVLADEQPQLWEQISSFAQRQREQHEHIALDIEPMVERWLAQAHEDARESMLLLRKGVASLLAHHDAQRDVRRDPIGRLAEIRFRGPEMSNLAEDGVAYSVDAAAAATRARVMY